MGVRFSPGAPFFKEQSILIDHSSSSSSPVIYWFRQDLRLNDNPALNAAAKAGPVIPIYILDTTEPHDTKRGEASKWWLHHSLSSLKKAGIPLMIYRGDPLDILKKLSEQTQAQGIYWNRCYDPHSRTRDKNIKQNLPGCRSYNGSLLREPWEVLNQKREFYKVFTPFWKACQQTPSSRVLESTIHPLFYPIDGGFALDDLGLIAKNPTWSKKFQGHWKPGEEAAHQALDAFITLALKTYKEGRDYPALNNTSRLSPHLHFGEISPHQIWHRIMEKSDLTNAHTIHFLSELGWRDFSYYLLYHFPQLSHVPFQEKFKHMTWESDEEKGEILFQAWKRGKTGYPLIDAGMRELWETGYMHNRVRMIVASFLTKHCLIPWQWGASWFWDTLVDADLANNSASWQWVAGCGADAAPYFRIFNPVSQSQKFDLEGTYIRQWVPELSKFSNKDIHQPWLTSIDVQQRAQCIIGKNYPTPIIELGAGRNRALELYRNL